MSAVHVPGITAPPSTAYKIVDVPENHRDVIRRHGVPGTFVGSSMEESPWVPFGDKAAIRHLAFDTRRNTFGNILWIKRSGLVHALVSDHPQGVKLFGRLQGPIEFYDEQGRFIETLDVWWFINHYETYCREHDIPINPQLCL